MRLLESTALFSSLGHQRLRRQGARSIIAAGRG